MKQLLVVSLACTVVACAGRSQSSIGEEHLHSATVREQPCASNQVLIVRNGSAETIRVYGVRPGDPLRANGSEILADVTPRTVDTLVTGAQAFARVESQSLTNPRNPDNSPRVPRGVELACGQRA